MIFAEPLYAWLLIIPAVWLILELVRVSGPGDERWPRIRRLWAGPSGVKAATRGSLASPRWRMAVGLTWAVVALMRPQFGRIEEKVFDQSREVLIALDLSRSMLAEDVKPNRLTRSRLLIENLLDKLKGERVGLLLFSGTSFLQSPLSADYEVLREFLPALDPEYLPEGGTDYDRMLKTALDSFSNEGGADRYLIVLSDGESQTDDWRKHLDDLKKRDVRVIALGVGTAGGSVMPAKGGGYVKDERGAVVMTHLEPATLQQLASATGGAYVDASTWVDLPAVLAQTVDRGRKGRGAERTTLRFAEQYQWYLAAALLLFAWSYWIEFPVRPRPRDVKKPNPASPPPASATAVTSALLLLFGCALASPPRLAAAQLVPPKVDAAAPAADPELPKIVARLSGKPALNASDCAHFARETLAFGEGERATQRPLRPGIVHDGLVAVDLGESLNSKEADWPQLRAALQKLLEPPPEQKKPEDQKKDNKQDQSQKQDQQQQKQDQSKPEPKDSEKQDAKDQQQGNSGQPEEKPQDQNDPQQSQQPREKAFDKSDKKDEPKPAEQNSAEPPPADDQKTQTVGGEKPSTDELDKNPQLALPLQKLDEARSKDSPAQLFKMLQRDEPQPQKPKKDW